MMTYPAKFSLWLTIVIVLLFLAWIVLAYGAGLPDKDKTPGLVKPMTKAQVCSTRWLLPRGGTITENSERRVTLAMKRQVFRAYGIECSPITKKAGQPRCSDWEIDHLVPRSLGGADDERNLFPQPMKGQWNARMKDRLERRLHVEVCAGRVNLQEAQHLIAEDWTRLYTKYFIDDGK